MTLSLTTVIFLTQFCICVMSNFVLCLTFWNVKYLSNQIHFHCVWLIKCKSLTQYKLMRRVCVRVYADECMPALCLCACVCVGMLAWVWTVRISVYVHMCALWMCAWMETVRASAVMCSWHVVNKVSPMCVWDGMLYSFTSNSLHIQFISQRGREEEGRERVKAKEILEEWYRSDRKDGGGG